jgi:lysyl-tRNA synthetase class I
MRSHEKESVSCQCYNCGKRSTRVYNFTLGKWARAFRCKCGSESFRWSR